MPYRQISLDIKFLPKPGEEDYDFKMELAEEEKRIAELAPEIYRALHLLLNMPDFCSWGSTADERIRIKALVNDLISKVER